MFRGLLLGASAALASAFWRGFCDDAVHSAWPVCDMTQSLDARSADIVSRLSLDDKFAI
jgi:hypothetical protein